MKPKMKFFNLALRRTKLLDRYRIYCNDNNRLDYPCGIVVNGNIYTLDLNYSEKDCVKHLLCFKCALLLREFWYVLENKIKEKIKSVIITLGEDDRRSLTPRVLKLLNESYPELKKNAIIGKGFKNIEEIEKAADKNSNLICFPNVKKIKESILEFDIAISAGGQTLYELAKVGLPTIAIAVADNQLHNIKGWEQTGFINFAGWWNNDIYKEIEQSLNILSDYSIRKNISYIGKRLLDSKGSNRAVDFFVTMFYKRYDVNH